MPMQFKIITPMRTALEAEVTSIHLPATTGEMEVLPGHASIITSVANGELTYTCPGQAPQSLFVGGGFLQVDKDDVLLVTDTALTVDEIDTSSIEKALERAQAAFRDSASVLDREEQAKLEAAISKQLAMLDFRKKRRI
ncbi:MAG: ATP synthase F1 subunit epsilon [Akkermansia sp.]|nr:ATP synthase F1 subunit epsilon [Akkermansia sp.]